ncbi:uncharacterized protein TRAVEDRAFT_60089 [Trametes versicolor FP-101664 SS1]|uniref:uncharacterized protein n=1 Tax=Trametes versicolor (strain FP-101664) TaxID=717944 RepID=UPI0004623E6C|nr:uncharacterized protein TRAVEDRAFT_60089 [Trametes versicolor FP-101664 SS1]EIW56057.1 hypothetical protein TRAVEDRAFT_60089 [Trametes versicolor FP-101664 SS1]
MRNSLEHWKHVPTIAETLFAIDVPYRPPKNAVGAFLWRWRFWLETTWGLSLLEPWEKILVLAFFYLLLVFVFTGVYKIMPQELPLLHGRLLYYLGSEETIGAGIHARHLVDWARHNISVWHL